MTKQECDDREGCEGCSLRQFDDCMELLEGITLDADFNPEMYEEDFSEFEIDEMEQEALDDQYNEGFEAGFDEGVKAAIEMLEDLRTL